MGRRSSGKLSWPGLLLAQRFVEHISILVTCAELNLVTATATATATAAAAAVCWIFGETVRAVVVCNRAPNLT